MKISEALLAAADLIEADGAWTQGSNARNAKREKVRFSAPDAICWCADGAILRINGEHGPANDFFCGFLGGQSVQKWNDDRRRTQGEVVAKLREAAK